MRVGSGQKKSHSCSITQLDSYTWLGADDKGREQAKGTLFVLNHSVGATRGILLRQQMTKNSWSQAASLRWLHSWPVLLTPPQLLMESTTAWQTPVDSTTKFPKKEIFSTNYCGSLLDSTGLNFYSTTSSQPLHNSCCGVHNKLFWLKNNSTTVFLSRYSLLEVWWSPVESIEATSVIKYIDWSHFCIDNARPGSPGHLCLVWYILVKWADAEAQQVPGFWLLFGRDTYMT
jgi:hypothetical protein